MKTRKLIELYGHRFTVYAQLAGVVAIVVFGILIAFSNAPSDRELPAINVEQNA